MFLLISYCNEIIPFKYSRLEFNLSFSIAFALATATASTYLASSYFRSMDVDCKLICCFAFCVLFTVLGSVRWNTGTDWDAYYYGFLSADSLDYVLYSPYAFEKGFGLLNFIILNYFNSYTVFLLVFTFITVFLKYKVITHKIFLNYALFSLFAYYCIFIGDIVATRQSMAVSITLFSTLFIIRKKLVWFILTVILASSIHRSAIVFIVAYPLFNYDFRQKTLISIYFIHSNLIY